MGREIRRVPAGWEHPMSDHREGYQPQYDRSYTEAAARWKAGYLAWENGEDPDRAENPDTEYWDWDGMPPEKEFYRPEWPDEIRAWYQLYETVSEGCPVSPPFETPEELARYLADNGDFWYQKRNGRARDWFPNSSYEDWLKFIVGNGWAPSLIIHDGQFINPIDMQPTP